MKQRIIDLSMTIYDKAPTMPMDPKCSVDEHSNLDTLGYNITRLTLSTHQGTHLDAPYHFFYDGVSVDRLDLEKCIGTAIKVDLTHKRPKEIITIEDFSSYDEEITKGSFIICHTGWDKMYPKNEYFSDFPNFSLELSEWFVSRGVALLGMDTPTPNATDWKTVHETLLGAEIVIVEGLCNLEKITMEQFLFMCFPLKIKDRDGSPVRAVAIEGVNKIWKV